MKRTLYNALKDVGFRTWMHIRTDHRETMVEMVKAGAVTYKHGKFRINRNKSPRWVEDYLNA